MAKTPCNNALPIRIGTEVLSEIVIDIISSIATSKGQEDGLSKAIKAVHGLAWPKPNRATGKQGARAIWFADGQIMLMGLVPDPKLAKHAAVVDQSDAWCVVQLEGPKAPDILARLCPVDLRPSQFKRGHTARSLIGHMSASITRTGENAYMIMVFRSMAKTLIHEVETAMMGVSARAF